MTAPREAGRDIRLSRGIPPIETIPVQALAGHAREVVAASGAAAFQYAALGGYRGDPALLRELGLWHDVDPQAIFVGNGSLQVLDLLSAYLLRQGPREVLVEAPSYDRAIGIFERRGARVLGVPMQPDGMDLDTLQALLRVHRPAFLYTIPDFQNPSGATLSADKRRRLLALAHEHGLTIVEDVPYRALRYAGDAPASLLHQADGVRVITLGSLSKVLSPGLRIGYALADPGIAVALARLAEDTYLCAPPLCQAIAARAMASGLLQSNVLAAREFLTRRHDDAARAVRDALGDRMFVVPGGGYFMSAFLPTRRSEEQLIEAAASQGVVLAAGSHFFPQARPPEGTFFLRIPFQALGRAELEAALGVVLETAEGS